MVWVSVTTLVTNKSHSVGCVALAMDGTSMLIISSSAHYGSNFHD